MAKTEDLIQEMLVLVDEIEKLRVSGKDVKKKFEDLERKNSDLFNLIDVKDLEVPVVKTVERKVLANLSLNEKEMKRYVKELNLNYRDIDDFVILQRGKKTGKLAIKEPDYTIYKPNQYGEIANKYMKKKADSLVAKHPKLFAPLFGQFNTVNVNVLSRTYVSMILFYGLLSFPMLIVLLVVLNLSFKMNWFLVAFLIILGTGLTFVGFYFYPASLKGDRDKKIKLELPFALVHMSAVAGSGAQPISIFELLADSGEFVELKREIRRILNYVNLFGYNLTTALRAVSNTTPSKDFKELLEGMISTVETGGNLSGYLKEKADDALSTYKLERQKQVESLATYSDIYTAILITAPLLLIVTLAIINSIGGQLGGMDVNLIAWIGVLGAMPLLNIAYLVFLNVTQPDL